VIVGSIALILVSSVFFALGLTRESDPFYYSSIVTSGLAAFALMVGVRVGVVGVPSGDELELRPDAAEWLGPRAVGRADVPDDEPGEQPVSPVAAAMVARLGATVLVIDGRPRYHLTGCLHLLGRDIERLAVTEAVELGFTPCAQCEPVTTLLRGASSP
jgi:hypothetical protein